jgi:2-haloacid dehalogenase
MTVKTVVFDLGGVLLDWNPRYVYRQVFAGDEARMEWFLREVCGPEWNTRQDAGHPWDDAIATLSAKFPDYAEEITAYRSRWEEMLGGIVDGTLDILRRLNDSGVPLYALTNWSADTFLIAYERYDFFRWFKGIVVSGRERMVKPDPRIYQLLIDRYQLTPAETVFIDDAPANVAGGAAAGFTAIRFTDPPALERSLRALALPV